VPPPSTHIHTSPAHEAVVDPISHSTDCTSPITEEALGDDSDEAVPTASTVKPPDPPRQLWVDVLSGNRHPANGLAMEYVATKRVDGEIEVEIEAADVDSEIQYWASSLIMYVLGGDLSMSAVKQFVIRHWSFVKLPDMFYNEEGYFILRFHSLADKDAVMMQGPYTIRNMPMLLHDWKPYFSLKRDLLRTLPIWVKLPQLPLHLWGVKSLSKIGSAIGNPLVTDECTAHKLRVSYARLLIEMDVTQALPPDITIKDSEGNKLKQLVEYEWKPLFCDKCQKLGHKCEQAPPKKVQPFWRPKSPTPEVITPGKAPVHDAEDSNWTIVQGSGKLKGKGVQHCTPIINISCNNGFEPLGTLNGPLVIQDTRQ
jgi:hypothetical protein